MSEGCLKVLTYSSSTGTRWSTTPRFFLSRSRLPAAHLANASGEEKSGFQTAARLPGAASSSRMRYLSMPATILAARSPSQSSGLVPANGCAAAPRVSTGSTASANRTRYLPMAHLLVLRVTIREAGRVFSTEEGLVLQQHFVLHLGVSLMP